MNIQFSPNWRQAVLEAVGDEEIKAVGKTVVQRSKANVRGSSGIRRGLGYEVTTEGGKRMVRIYSKDFKSHWFEFGTRKMSARPFLRPAIESLGLKWQRAGKR